MRPRAFPSRPLNRSETCRDGGTLVHWAVAVLAWPPGALWAQVVGVSRVGSVVGGRWTRSHLHRLPHHLFKRSEMSVSRPCFQFDIIGRPKAKLEIRSAVFQFESRDYLRVAAVKTLRHAEHRRQEPNGTA